MPALGQAPGDFEELVLGGVVDQALEEVEADAADAALVQRRKFGFGNGGIDHGDAPREAIALRDGVERGSVVGAVAAGLNDDIAREAQMIAQREQHVRPGVFGEVQIGRAHV